VTAYITATVALAVALLTQLVLVPYVDSVRRRRTRYEEDLRALDEYLQVDLAAAAFEARSRTLSPIATQEDQRQASEATTSYLAMLEKASWLATRIRRFRPDSEYLVFFDESIVDWQSLIIDSTNLELIGRPLMRSELHDIWEEHMDTRLVIESDIEMLILCAPRVPSSKKTSPYRTVGVAAFVSFGCPVRRPADDDGTDNRIRLPHRHWGRAPHRHQPSLPGRHGHPPPWA
jgi:hypothetical protein